jgi:hypothetical protein
MKRFTLVVFCLLVAVPSLFAAGRPAPNNNKALQGTYSFVLHGTYTGNSMGWAASGVLIFDGAGNITGGSATVIEREAAVQGPVVPPFEIQSPIPNVYTLGMDGTGTFSVNLKMSNGKGILLTAAIAAADNVNKIYINVTSHAVNPDGPSTVIATGEAEKQ